MPDALKEQVFSHLEQLAAVANLSEANRLAYDKAVDRYNVSRIVENDIREKAMTEGMEKGIEKGIEKVARKLKAGGVSIELIMQATGLSAEEIAKL